ncbi:MAG: hypothetical protein ACJAYB_001992 [Psychromonas sp.]|jgi:hypothetical protein
MRLTRPKVLTINTWIVENEDKLIFEQGVK